MKKTAINGLFLLIAVLTFSACGSSMTALQKQQKAAEIENALRRGDFTFEADYAHPFGFSSIYLSPYYDVKVSSDTVKAYLPYYGRAYTAPMNPREGGYNFTSTDFEYRFSQGDKSGNYMVDILIKDLDRQVVFNFYIYDNGSGRLSVSDVNRQTISYQGEIILKEQ